MIWKTFLENYGATELVGSFWLPLDRISGDLYSSGAVEEGKKDLNTAIVELAEKTELFCFAEALTKDLPPVKEKRFLLDLPFDSIWIEGGGKILATIGIGDKINNAVDGLPKDRTGRWSDVGFEIHGLMLAENDPELAPDDTKFGYMYVAYGRCIGPARTEALQIAVGAIERIDLDDRTFSVGSHIHDLATQLFSVMNQTKRDISFGIEKVSERVRIGTGQNRKQLKIRNLVHLAPKKSAKLYALESKKDIDWSHRWEVRGHWRKITGIGKNRYDDYCVKGFTWVVPHSKGPEEKDLVKKTRWIGNAFLDSSNDAPSSTQEVVITTE